ncbi:hypothetical protein [Echinicola rosea]|uniref:Oligosaccharide repeat unit polymerase n=1 Tax=Echinicola rosea TaxID=1807691 RepID=A0ABQ1VBW4_9BACT|nr:hypothetical protein [Echinicola rosea]GGF46888.1 hypothetical protein GCM10011339_39300 [Echinicola rosea]
MIGGVILIGILYAVSLSLLQRLKRKYRTLSIRTMTNLYWYHMLFALIYYTYAIFRNSDSHAYYHDASTAASWWKLFSHGTHFIEWIAVPFVQYLHFSYEMMMVLFAWTGYIGFVYFYLFFRENLRLTIKFRGYNAVNLLMFLPNMHFWTSSLGKGSLIFCGIGLLVFGLSLPAKRKVYIALGGLLTYFVRPHIFFAIMIGMGMSFMLGREKMPMYQKVLVAIGGIGISAFIYDELLVFLRLDEDNVLESFMNNTAFIGGQLQHAGSAVDMQRYSLPVKLFTFWFRPLFFDAPNFLGIFVSLENLLYLAFFVKLFQKGFFRFIKQASAMVKMSAVVFLSISFSMTFIMSNLGIIIRQKSMIMYFMFFVIVAFLDWKKNEAIKRRMKRIERMKKKEHLKVQKRNYFPDHLTN